MNQELFSIKAAVEVHGINNIKILIGCRPLRKAFFIKYTSSSDEYHNVMCKIKEDRYKVKDNYKITIVPFHPNFADHSFYISDLDSMINNGHARVYIDISPRLAE